MRRILLSILFLFSLHANAQWNQRIAATRLAPGLNQALSNSDGSLWYAGLYRGTVEIGGAGAPVIFNSTNSGDPEQFRYTGFMAKYTSGGTLAWTRELRSPSNRLNIQGMLEAPGQGAFLLGGFNGFLILNAGQADADTIQAAGQFESPFIARYSATGDLLWVKVLPANNNFFTSAPVFQWVNNQLVFVMSLNFGDIDLDPGTGTTRVFTPFLQPDETFFVMGVYDANGDFVRGGPFAKGNELSVGRADKGNGQLAIPLSFTDTATVFLGGTSAVAGYRRTGNVPLLLLTSNLSSISASYLPEVVSPAVCVGFMANYTGNRFRLLTALLGGTLDFNPGVGVDSVNNLQAGGLTLYESSLSATGNYLGYRKVAAATGQNIAAFYAGAGDTSQLLFWGGPGVVVNDTTVFGTQPDHQPTLILKENGPLYIRLGMFSTNVLGVPFIGSNTNSLHLAIRWRNSLYFNNQLLQQGGMGDYVELMQSNLNGLGLATADDENQPASVYPNPATDFVLVKPGDQHHLSFQLYDLQGKLVLQQSIENGLEHQIRVDQLPKGTYLWRWQSVNRQGSGKIIKN